MTSSARPEPTAAPIAAAAELTPRQLGLRWLEFALLFLLLPGAYVLGWLDLPLIPTLLAYALLCLILLLRDPSFDRRRLGRGGGRLREQLRWPLLRFGLAVPLLIALTWAIDAGWLDAPTGAMGEQGLLLSFPRTAPAFWALVMLLYPLLSVYPQEIVFRSFLFHRYAPLFGRSWGMVLVSAALFGAVHAFFALWPAFSVAASALGGLLFARTYQRSGSTLAAVVEHALYGDLVFTIGLGIYFYAGAG